MSRPLLEFGGGSGDILRDLLHLRSVVEAEALISGAEGRDQLRHGSMSLQAPEPLGRFEEAIGDPAQHHLAAPPALHVAFDVAGPADEALGGVGRGPRAPETRREASVSTVTVSSCLSRTLAAAQGCSRSRRRSGCRSNRVAVLTSSL